MLLIKDKEQTGNCKAFLSKENKWKVTIIPALFGGIWWFLVFRYYQRCRVKWSKESPKSEYFITDGVNYIAKMQWDAKYGFWYCTFKPYSFGCQFPYVLVKSVVKKKHFLKGYMTQNSFNTCKCHKKSRVDSEKQRSGDSFFSIHSKQNFPKTFEVAFARKDQSF